MPSCSADVTDRHAVVAAANRIELDLGCADVLINNAGVMLLGPFGSGQREEARPASRRRRRPGQHLLRRRTDRPRRQRRLRGDDVEMNGWSEALRQELQPDIRVTVIEPGAVATELANHITDPAAKQGAEQLYAELAITPRRRRSDRVA